MTGTTEETIDREAIRVTKSDDGPVLRIGNTEILLRTFLDLPSEEELHGERVPLDVEVDCDGPNGCWWNLNPEDGDLYPWVTIQPEVRDAE